MARQSPRPIPAKSYWSNQKNLQIHHPVWLLLKRAILFFGAKKNNISFRVCNLIWLEIKNFQTFLYSQYTLENPTQVFKATVFKYDLLHGGNHEPFLPRHMGHLQNNPLPVTTISQGTAQKFGQTKNLKQIEQKLQTIKSHRISRPLYHLGFSNVPRKLVDLPSFWGGFVFDYLWSSWHMLIHCTLDNMFPWSNCRIDVFRCIVFLPCFSQTRSPGWVPKGP